MSERADHDAIRAMKVADLKSPDGTTIAYRHWGSGPGLVLLHGAMLSSQSFSRLAEALADSFHVYVPDCRGRGRSGSFGSAYGLDREVEDLESLLKQAGATRVFGLSSGALIRATRVELAKTGHTAAENGGRPLDVAAALRPFFV